MSWSIEEVDEAVDAIINEAPIEDIQKALDALIGLNMNVADATVAMLAALATGLMQEPEGIEDVKKGATLYPCMFMRLITNVGTARLRERDLQ